MSVDGNGRINTTVNEAMTQEFRKGNHVCYAFSVENGETTWYKISKPPKDRYISKFKLILKEHEEIADAVLANSDVEVEWFDKKASSRWSKEEGDFFEKYESILKYRLAKPQCDGNAQVQTNDMEDSELTYGEAKNPPHGVGEEETEISFYKDLKDGGLLYGCEDTTIYDVIEDLKVIPQNQRVSLTVNAVVKEWFEDESNFPAMVVDTQEPEYEPIVFTYKDIHKGIIESIKNGNVRLATKEEVNSLYYQDKE